MNAWEASGPVSIYSPIHISLYARNKVSLEFVQINIEGSIEAERRRDRGDNLSDKPVKVRETRRRNAKVLLADIVDSFIINLI